MDKVGIPRSLFYYYYKDIWKVFFRELGVSYVVSPNTNKEIVDRGMKIAGDEMCLAFKNYLGHVDYLKDKCTYIFVPRICNYGSDNQMCTNFFAAYDIVNNLFDNKIISYNIDLSEGFTLKKGLYDIGKFFKKNDSEIKKAYKIALAEYEMIKMKDIEINLRKLSSDKTKILIVSHPYNIYDSMIGRDIIKYLKKEDVEIIYSDKFREGVCAKLSKKISPDLYFRYSKQNIGSIIYTSGKIDGVIFLTSFPCAPDSLVNELAIRKIKIPNINMVVDASSSFTGMETRLESFLDVLRGNVNV